MAVPQRLVPQDRFSSKARKSPVSDKDAIASDIFEISTRYETCLTSLASVYRLLRDDVGERECDEEAYALSEQLRNRRGMGTILGNLASIDRPAGRTEIAAERYRASYDVALELGNVDGQVHTLAGQAYLLEDAGRLAEAEALHEQAVRLAREHGLSQRLIAALCDWASLLERRGGLHEAESALREAQGVVQRLRQELQVPEDGPQIQQA